MPASRRLTQQDIAKLAGVSQATVSLVLNGAANALARIPPDTRERVQKIIRETGYVPDPIARRMAKGSNRILGVFTYEPAFPNAHADFFLPFLFGIEEEAQARGDRSLALPLYPMLGDDEVDYVIRVVRQAAVKDADAGRRGDRCDFS